MSDLFTRQGISPMLLEESKPFDGKDYIFELKLDGFRCIAYLDKGLVSLKSRNGKDLTAIFPELKSINKCVKKRCVLDGEIVSLKDGKPNFQSLQKRNLFKKEAKIIQAANINPVQFVAFDILYLGEDDLRKTPQILRKEQLSKCVKEGFNLSISRYIEEFGIDFFNLIKAQNLEGIVAKRKAGFYYSGKRTREWLKIKAVLEEDFLICGYIPDKDGNVKDVILGSIDEIGALICVGKVYLPNKNEQKKVANYALNNTVKTPWFTNFKGATWIKPNLKATVCYLEKTLGGSLRHPVLKEVNKA